jgi:uncharacterized membrane protein
MEGALTLNPRRQGPDLNDSIGKVLRYGVVLSSAVVAVGLALLVLAPPPGTPGTLQGLLAAGFGRPTLSPAALVEGVRAGDAISVLQLGTLILLATPLARVAASVLLFLRDGDMIYVGIALLVLATLLISIFVVGPMQA